MKQNKKVIGVWLDHRSASLVGRESDESHAEYKTIQKVHAHNHVAHGGSEHTKNTSKHGDIEKYYKELSALLVSYTDILIFGPGKAQEEFFNHLVKDKHFEGKRLSVETAGDLTDNQLHAFVREFFKPIVSN